MPGYEQVKLDIKIVEMSVASRYQVVNFDGNLDKFGLDLVRDKLDELINSFTKEFLVFDFAKLNFINSESIGFLMTAHYRLTKKSKSLVIVHAPDNVKDVLDVIGLLGIIKYFSTLEEFEKSLI